MKIAAEDEVEGTLQFDHSYPSSKADGSLCICYV